MNEVIGKFLTEWPIVSAAPFTFLVTLAAALIIVGPLLWLILSWLKSQQIENRDSHINLLQQQVLDYQDKLKGASPSEAKARIDKLEARIQELVETRWRALTKEEIDGLILSLRGIQPPPARLIIVHDANGAALARSFDKAFESVNWQVERDIPLGRNSPGLRLQPASPQTTVLKNAITKATGIEVALVAIDDTSQLQTDDIFLWIGETP